MGYQPTSGHDPHDNLAATGTTGASPDPVFASTASMQNLLFEHFAALQQDTPSPLAAMVDTPSVVDAFIAPEPVTASKPVTSVVDLTPVAASSNSTEEALIAAALSALERATVADPADTEFQSPSAYAAVPELDDDALSLAQLTRIVADIAEETKAAARPPQAPITNIRPVDQEPQTSDYQAPLYTPDPSASYARVPSLKMVPTPVSGRNPEASGPARSHITEPPKPQLDPNDPATWPLAAKILIEDLKAENEKLKTTLREEASRALMAESLAETDVLTPTLNRRGFTRELQRAIADCKRYGEQACVIYLDLDGFKMINDSYGHGAGDAALVHVAEVLRQNIREGDAVGRLGGDEFALLLRRAELQPTKVKAMMLEAELSVSTFAFKDLYLKVGGSFGVRAYMGQNTPEEWLAEADAAMFLVKKSLR